MKIAFVTPEYVTDPATYDGGLANYVHRVSLSLIQLGHEPHVIYWSDKEPDADFEQDGVQVHRVLVRRDDLQLKVMQRWHRGTQNSAMDWMFVSKKLNNKLKKINKDIHFDIVQYASYRATGYHRAKSIPAVARISSYEPVLREARGNLSPNEDDLRTEVLERDALKKMDGVFGPSKLIGEIVAKDIGKEVTLIETPFVQDTKNLDESIYAANLAGKKYLLFFGSLNRIKGIDVIAEVLEKLFASNPELYFVFVGKDVGDSVALLKSKSGSYSDRVIYLGKLPHSQLYPVIQNCDFVVLPSRTDNFPNTCLEAMSFRKIVIGTFGTSFEQLIDDGVSGFLCKREDPADLHAVIEKVLNLSPESKMAIEEKSFARTEALKPEKVVTQLIAYYSDIIAARSHQ